MRVTDISGQRFGLLTAVEYIGDSKWRCKCDCGNECNVKSYNLKNGNSTSCGCAREAKHKERIEAERTKMVGKTFGRLTVIEYDKTVNNHGYYKCRCTCGNTVSVETNNLKSGRVVSCGCRLKEQQNDIAKVPRLSGSNAAILRTQANINNKTKVRGVFFNKSLGLYVANIQYKKQRYILLTSKYIEPCIKAREKAEEHIRRDFLEWYTAWKENNNDQL